MARHDMGPIVTDLQLVTTRSGSSLDVVLDFSGVVSATASYLKRSLLWLHECARLAAEGKLAGPSDDPPIPLDICIFVAGLEGDVRAELDDVLFQHNRTCLEVVAENAESVVSSRILGPLDPALMKTLDALLNVGQATATELHQADNSPERQKVSVNAWNNRLNDLYCKRLVRRTKVGRHWVYEPATKEIQHNG